MHDGSALFQELSEEELVRCTDHYLGEELISWKLLTGGLFNTTYFLETPSRRMILRLGPINRERLLPYELPLMKTEPIIQQLLHSRGIPTSGTVVLDTGRTFLDRDVAIVECINGHNMGEVSLPERQRKAVERQLGTITRKLHSITARDLKEIPEKPFGRTSLVLSGKGCATWREAILEEVRQWRCCAKSIGLFEEDFLERVENVFEKFSGLFDDIKVPVLIHGDLWYGNILVDDKMELAAIIDIDRSLFGDPEFEFAMLLVDKKTFAEGYGDSKYKSRDTQLRGMLYKFLVNLEDSYILRHEYCAQKDCQELQWLLRRKLQELENL